MQADFRQADGYVALVLHAHLPFVRHPENEDHLEELWFFEAVTDTYLPLLRLMEGWAADGIPFRLTLSVTPPLAAMLSDPLLLGRYERHLERLGRLAARELSKVDRSSPFFPVVSMYCDRTRSARRDFAERYGRDLLGAFRRLVPHGLELIASAATHPLLPLIEPVRSAARAQIEAGVRRHEEVFGEPPKGFWLPECGFHPAHAAILTRLGIRYTFVETHGVLHGRPRPRYAVYAPVYTPEGLAVFGRDVESSKQVWSADEGYPGDFDYREFYRDAGHDLPWEEIAPYLPWGVRTDTGLKYYRITGRTNHKEVYDPDRAREKARLHAGNFVFNRVHQVRHLRAHMDRRPVVVAPYDAELFGHWWFEGPWFLDDAVRLIHESGSGLALVTPSDYLEEYPTNQVVEVSPSTWGYKGYHEVWLERSNEWIYPHLHEASRRMERLASAHPSPPAAIRRALAQAARELMLAQSSDWAFIMKTGTAVEYAVRRTKEHIRNFLALEGQIERGAVDEAFLRDLEARHNLLPSLDYRLFLPGTAGEGDGAALPAGTPASP